MSSSLSPATLANRHLFLTVTGGLVFAISLAVGASWLTYRGPYQLREV
ncbi:hypothetical protein [Hymenobacter psoromatis]|nr:hypothetical protein [Hymenobacter psoromatis]